MTERWAAPPGWSGLYLVSDRGRLYSVRKKRIMKTPSDGNGYLQVNLYRAGKDTHYTVHTLVLETFGGPCPVGMEARHLDGIKSNCRHTNLVWGTPEQNHADRLNHGTSNRGERHGLHRLTEADVLDICDRADRGDKSCDIAASIGCSRQCVDHVVSGRRWSWLTGRAKLEAA